MDPLGELGAELSGRPATATSAALQEPPITQPPALLCSPVKFCLPAAEPLPLPPHLQHLQLQQQLYSYALQQLHGLRPPAPTLVAPPWSVAYPYKLLDPRLAALCRPPEEPKPQHSYIGLIAMAILSHADKKLVLSDIYQYILDNYSYFRNRGTGWRNSIRHNLSLNDCFVKAGRSPNGKGHYWAIHPANIEDFKKGDFRRRKAQRRVRKHMGLTVDDEDSLSPPPPPTPSWAGLPPAAPPRRRQFDVASLLAPDVPGLPASPPRATPHSCEVELDVVGGDEELPDQLSPLAVQHHRPAVPPLPPSPPTPGGGDPGSP